MHCKTMDWFLYNGNTVLNWVKGRNFCRVYTWSAYVMLYFPRWHFVLLSYCVCTLCITYIFCFGIEVSQNIYIIKGNICNVKKSAIRGGPGTVITSKMELFVTVKWLVSWQQLPTFNYCLNEVPLRCYRSPRFLWT